MLRFLKYIVPLTILYVALTNNFEWRNWLLGVVLSVVIVWLIQPDPDPIHWSHLPQAALRSVQFLALLMWDLIMSGIGVAKLVVQRSPDIKQGIVAIPDATDKGWITTASAEAITLTPGELVVEIGEDGTLYTHTLNVPRTLANSVEEQAKRAQQLEEISA